MSLIVHYHFPCGHTDSEVYEPFEIFCKRNQEAKEQDVVMDGSCVHCKMAELEQWSDESCEFALEEDEWELEMAWDV